MKRSSLLFVCAAIVVGFIACGKAPKLCDPDNLMEKAQLCPDRESLGFAQEFGSGTFIGTRPIEALSIRNGGIADLNLSSITTTGDSAFKYTASWDSTLSATTVKGNKTVFIQVEFAPTAPQRYTGSITINSNAENSPSKTFTVSGCGVPPDKNTSCTVNADCNDANQRCSGATTGDGGVRGRCVGVSPCYRDGGVTP